jgi:hypothetical protein
VPTVRQLHEFAVLVQVLPKVQHHPHDPDVL